MPIQQYTIVTREGWLKKRFLYTTASVAAALPAIDRHPYITPLRLYLEKSGVEFPERDTGPKEMGRRLEAVVAEIVSERRPDWELENPNTFYFDDDEGLGATPDRIIHNDPQGLGILQIKTTRPDTFEHAWDKGRDVPFFIVVQTQVEMWAVGSRVRGDRGDGARQLQDGRPPDRYPAARRCH